MIIDGREIAKKIKERVKNCCANCTRKPSVVAIMLGEDPSAEAYLRMLERTCKSVDFDYTLKRYETSLTEAELLKIIQENNEDPLIDGIIVQMPLPGHISEERVIMAIDPKKDLDGFHPLNAGRLFKGEKATRPCTPLAVMTIFDELEIDLNGKDIVVIGRSNIVGKPLAVMLMHKNATVTLCHSHTVDLASHTKKADIIIVAVGIANFLTSEMVSEKSIVIDVGMNELDGKLVGDVDFEGIKDQVQMITPVPGGVGPVTNAVLLLNLLENFGGICQ
ncbi:bifunctional 5,10-methylenetetrahydrofolate dehydrogenase/5,10-methenyltetrahydrofolate cyclohydrolase [Fusibacter tunisiensis]|jgi:methylenetetrahydrofolate dehydrogenase (NADP+)/methenyltetrahydrofolate cyclohydrolase|uniref:Bifunctional protein FolD n=1 Tax=Fusibacter tunisiensis TaxID=1008308 RepID=A0ABS2MS07_9FIRM|nr:bifunctional 5,10-methylenetetrahydrofolate dehydrogenase/5,10-methenyltetrahydrofolate cyclohydrolase [Fusibacter tunisiensis]MBM7562169.1 methylenetetrahydrofolate dehydrogenase (NADP+)/methenyltetrahydrofolate cyclohydrolase [Fusibacter tunisiensis]